MRKRVRRALPLLLLIVASWGAAAGADPGGDETELQNVTFRRQVVNLEYQRAPLSREMPVFLRAAPPVPGTVRYGSIPRRIAGEDLHERGHFVPFLARFSGGRAVEALVDRNLNGDLTDDAPLRLSAYPEPEGARSFLADLRWSVPRPGPGDPVAWKIRVVLEPLPEGGGAHFYRLQSVFGNVGTVVLERRPHRAILFDGNADGLYTSDFGDGLFVDLNDDLHFEVDRMSPEFGPFRVPFQLGGQVLEVASVDAAGTRLSLRAVQAADVAQRARVGEPAPEFGFRDGEGRDLRLEDHRGRVVLVYFWTSWCGLCAKHAEPLRSLYDRYGGAGLEILGVSYDTDRAAMAEFRRTHGHTWPNSFTGRGFWENRVGRLYGAGGSGLIYLVDRGGRLDGIYTDVEEIELRVIDLLRPASAAAG